MPTPWGSARTSSSRGKSWRCAETKASAPANRWLDPQHEPVLHFLAFGAEVGRARSFEVMGLLLRLQGHHGGDALPGDEQPAGHRPAGFGLAPAGKKTRVPESGHGPDAVGRVGHDHG